MRVLLLCVIAAFQETHTIRVCWLSFDLHIHTQGGSGNNNKKLGGWTFEPLNDTIYRLLKSNYIVQ